MNARLILRMVNTLLRLAPLIFLGVMLAVFATFSASFLTVGNLGAILVQSSWLIIVALGMNLVLLTGGVDLSVGAAMYLAAIVVGIAASAAPVWICLPAAVLAGAAFGAVNGFFVVRLQVPAFIVTLATTFAGRGLGLYLSSTKVVFAGTPVADLGRSHVLGVPAVLWLSVCAVAVVWVLLRMTPFGPYIRSIGADREGARRAGVSTAAVTASVYVLCGAFAGLGGFVSLSQTSAAASAFGQNAEFSAIAAAVLGGTSLFGGRGGLWAPVIGAVLITTVQNGLVMIDANPYAYPVITGAVIFAAALLDSIRGYFVTRLEHGRIRRAGNPA
jgi:ribose transport system permease protein